MKSFLKKISLALVFVSTSAFPAPTSIGIGNITHIENSWYGEGFAISHTKTIAGCPLNSQYGLLTTHPQYKEIVALMIMAYSNNTPIDLVVDSAICVFGGRPSLIAIKMDQ